MRRVYPYLFIFFLFKLNHIIKAIEPEKFSKWQSYEATQVEEKYFENYLPKTSLTSSDMKTSHKKFRIAVLAAGALRSFAYAEKSWRHYMIEPWKENIFVFAHVLASKHCIFSQKGLDAIRDIAIEVEVGYSSTPLMPIRIVQKKLPDELKKNDYFRGHAKGMNRGNFFDMHLRRIRVYEMAKNYAERGNFEWDLYAFFRLDSVFYDPIIPFGRIYQGLINYIHITKKPALYIPTPCNFDGVCDRLAFGLPEQMDIFFAQDWPFEVLRWAVSKDPPGMTREAGYNMYEYRRVKNMMARNGNSEHLLKCWFIMNNFTQVYSVRERRIIAFATLRTSTADGYCHLTRENYLYRHPDPEKFIWEPDKMTAYPDHSSPYRGMDLKADPLMRCGPIYTMNATVICATKECNCGKYG